MKFCLISSGYIQNDPRNYFLANAFKKFGYEVTIVNIFLDSNQLPVFTNYKLFRNYHVLNIDFYKYIPKEFSAKYSDFFASYIYDLVPTFVSSYIEENNAEEFLQADIFYGLELFFGGVIAQQFAEKTKKDFIVDFKELFSEMNSSHSTKSIFFIKALEEKCINDSLCISCVSQKIIDYYKAKYNKSQDKFILLENSRPFDHLEPDFSKKENDKIRFIVIEGDANEDRGFNELAKIWEILDPNNAELDIRISNISDNQRNKIINIAQRTYGKSLNFIPSVLEDNLTESLLGYDCGIIPYLPGKNLNQKYCCPNKFGQYMNAGLAIISSNTEYITEKIAKHDLGIIYDPSNIDGSVEKFQDLIDNPEQLKTKRSNAYIFCKKEYEWNKHVIPLLDKLENFSARKKPSTIKAILDFFRWKNIKEH